MMKKAIASVLIFASMLGFAGCTDAAPETPGSVVPPVVESTEVEQSTRAVVYPYREKEHFTLKGTLDYDAFLHWLPDYFGTLYGRPFVVAVRDIIDESTEGTRGTVTLLAEYHTMDALESGRSVDTLCGGCNLFFTYDRVSGTDFAEEQFAGAELLENFSDAPGIDSAVWTATVDADGKVQLLKGGEDTIKTPGEYRWGMASFENEHALYVNGEHVVLLLVEHESLFVPASERLVYAYASSDGGESWKKNALDFTPITTTIRYPVTNLVLNMRDDLNGTAILGTNRCEVFFYTTDDGGKKWTKQRSFKLLNYQNEALLDGGMVTDTLGFITFIPRKGKNPNVYITYDGGKTWALMDITLPEGYSDADAYGTAAYLEASCVILPIVCSGETLYYISEDEGKTWNWQK